MLKSEFRDGAFAGFRTLAKPRSLAVLLLSGLSVTAAYNAVFGQEGDHPAAIFAMRDNNALLPSEQQRNVTRIVFQGQQPNDASPDAVTPAPLPEPTVVTRPVQSDPAQEGDIDQSVAELQQLLSQLGFYEGTIDGKAGPMTRQAIADYKISAGLQGIELDTDQLVVSARNNLLVTAAIPSSRPDGEASPTVETVVFTPQQPQPSEPTPASTPSLNDPMTIMQVQNALQQFSGNTIVVDGILGSQTRNAISEFQTLFRMDVTGEIDAALLEKMVSIGLLDG